MTSFYYYYFFFLQKKKTCAICLNTLIPGQGHAIFTAECSHSFHFNCITSNVNHENHICPICRAKWKEIPFQTQTSQVIIPQVNQNISPTYHFPEPATFNDDDLIEEHQTCMEQSSPDLDDYTKRVELKAYPEVSSIANSSCYDNFTILINLKAPTAKINDLTPGFFDSRAPVDLVTVLDVSGSMAGTKLALLKRAMGFVIQHLGPNDRLSVVVFSGSARRLFPLRCMTNNGRHQALQAVNALSSNGGTNIFEGLKKGAKIMLDRKCKNPVSSIILLSDGEDTYNVNGVLDYKSLLPTSIQQNSGTNFEQIPVHTFGFGSDHDSFSMHSISEFSGGTFSFIEGEGVIQDAFAQCMGGLLSVVIQDLKVGLECVYPSLQLNSIKSGNYHARVTEDKKSGYINVGDLYAEEERDFLVTMNVPESPPLTEMPLLKVKCSYNNPITKETVPLGQVQEVKIKRPEKVEHVTLSMEVDKQKNRLKTTEAMSEARFKAEHGDFGGAISVLVNCRETILRSISSQDPLCGALIHELKEMQERMSSWQVYEESGRAYILSGLSSHSWQRATVRGYNTSSTYLSQAYQTSLMADMITRSQTMGPR